MESAVYGLDIVIGAGVGALVVGLIVGLMVGKRTSAAGQKYREVERKLDQVMQDKKLYEDEVVEHFEETAQLLNTLTQSYREVHNHLAKGAAQLCEGEGPIALERLRNRDPSEIPSEMAQIQQPLDYAPKSSPDEKGMLNEEFGLERTPQSSVLSEPAKV